VLPNHWRSSTWAGWATSPWIDPTKARPEDAGALLAFDTGPANAPINDLMQERRNEAFDRDGQLAAQGRVADGVLEGFLEAAYFHRMPPKSLDRDSFAPVLQNVRDLSDADAAATLTAMCAASVMLGVRQCPAEPSRILVCGGGRHNPVLMDMLRAALRGTVEPVEEAGLDGDMIEAQAFAHLAVRVLRGLPTSCPGTTGVRAAVSGGTVSRPDGTADAAREAI
jgi:anhydro-N-acetylmuramic acid kinase